MTAEEGATAISNERQGMQSPHLQMMNSYITLYAHQNVHNIEKQQI